MGEDGLRDDEFARSQRLAAMGEFVLGELADLETAPACGIVGEEGHRRAAALSVPIRETPLEGGVDALVEILRAITPLSFNTPGPGYLAYVPGGGLFASALGDFVGAATNRFSSIAAAAPGFARLEQDVLAWLAAEFGYPETARGLLTPGGSMATFAAVVAARHRVFGDGGDYRDAVAYTSTQAHHSVAKALRLAGIPVANLRAIEVDDGFRLRVDRLVEQVEADRAAGKKPFLIVCAAGTTNTGAVDPLAEIVAAGRERGVWVHVDAAYGGGFVLCERGRALLEGIAEADSITFDPHKTMFLPYGTGCLLVREGEALRAAHQADAAYFQDLEREIAGIPPSAAEYGPELSRGNRGIRLWVPLVLHGAAAFRRMLDEKLDQARRFEMGLRERIARGMPVEIVAPAVLSTVAFRAVRRAGETVADWNARNAELLLAINARARVYLSSTALPFALREGDPAGSAAFTLRVCVVSFRTRDDRIDACLEDLDALISAR